MLKYYCGVTPQMTVYSGYANPLYAKKCTHTEFIDVRTTVAALLSQWKHTSWQWKCYF
jgi:hypothetical protein